MIETDTNIHRYDFGDTLTDLDGGVFVQKLSHAMHQTAAVVVAPLKAMEAVTA